MFNIPLCTFMLLLECFFLKYFRKCFCTKNQNFPDFNFFTLFTFFVVETVETAPRFASYDLSWTPLQRFNNVWPYNQWSCKMCVSQVKSCQNFIFLYVLFKFRTSLGFLWGNLFILPLLWLFNRLAIFLAFFLPVHMFSKHWPSGPMLSISQFVCVSVRVCVPFWGTI